MTHAQFFPTTVIGSLPRPQWIRELILDRKEKSISEEEADQVLDRAIESAILMQERAGLDEITDGEWRRESYVKVFAERVRGFEPDLVISGLPYPAVVAPIEYYRPIAAAEIGFLRPRTERRVKATLPGPYTIGRRMWHSEHSAKAYPTRELLMRACVDVLRREIQELKGAGADTVQLDEPWLNRLVDPAVRREDETTDIEYEVSLCVDLVNDTVADAGIDIGMHLCHAHFDHQHGSEGPYDVSMPGLSRLKVDTLSLELATPVSGGMGCLAQFPQNMMLGLGCIDHCDRTVETDEIVISRVEEAMKYVDAQRITLHPDCGFSPSVQNPMDLDEAYAKLKAMCDAAQLLRARHS